MSDDEKNLNGGTNGNGNGGPETVGDTEFFLVPLLASDPLPHFFDSEGNAIDADGNRITNAQEKVNISASVLRLQEEARPKRELSDV